MRTGKIRILYIQKPPGGGTATGLYDLVKGMDSDVYEPIVLFLKPNIYFDKFKKLGVQVLKFNNWSHAPIENSPTVYKRDIAVSLSKISSRLGVIYTTLKQFYLLIRNDLSVAHKISRVIKSLNVNIVHHNDNLPADRAAVLGAIFAKVPQVCHIRTLKRLSYVEKCLSQFVQAFIYMSKSIENLYIKEGISPQKGQVIYDPFNINEYEDIEAKEISEIRSEFGIKNSERLVCNVGRIVRWKGQHVFLKAFADIIKTEPRAKAIIVGSTDKTADERNYFAELKNMVRKSGLVNHVIFTGFRSDIPRIMASSDIIVHSSTNPEPFGRVIVEGMLAGKPVVATAAGGVLDIIDDGVTGLLVPVKNSAAMATVLLDLLKNPQFEKRISDKAKEAAVKRFNVSQHIEAIQKIYHEIVGIPKR